MEGGTTHSQEIVCYAIGVPLATYIKEGGREEAGQVGRARGSPTWTPSPSRIRPPFSFLPPEGNGREREGEGKRGPGPLP